jgi:hypothetical protein
MLLTQQIQLILQIQLTQQIQLILQIQLTQQIQLIQQILQIQLQPADSSFDFYFKKNSKC